MRITYLTPVGVIGGAERVLLAGLLGVRDAMPEASLDVILLADGPLRPAIERLGVRVTLVPLPSGLAKLGDSRVDAGLGRRGRARAFVGLGWSTFSSAPAVAGFLGRLGAALRRGAPDLIHTHGAKAHVFAALTRPQRTPLLWHLHDFPGQRPIMARLLRCLAGRAAGAVAVSEAVRRDAEATLPGLPITSALNPTDTTHFVPASRDGSGLDRLAGLPPARPGIVRVGLVATYAHWKGQDVFLDALAQLDDAGASTRGYLVGGPIYRTTGSQFTERQLRDRAAALSLTNRIGFIPFQDDPVDIYRMLDVVVHASTRPEPFGLTIAEAMACGRAVVVAAAGGAVELFTPGHDGVGHSPGDAQDLARVLASLIGDPTRRNQLGVNARQGAVVRHPPGRYGRELAAIYARHAALTPAP